MQAAEALRVLDWMSSLGDLTRVRLVLACEQQELSVAEICSALQLPQSTASRHLKVLSEDGWLAARREGTSRFYRFQRDGLPAPARQLWKLVRAQCSTEPSVRQDEARLERVLLQRQTQSQAFFASSAGHWDKLRTELFGQRFEVSSFLALLEPRATVGDLGCGTGGTTELLSDFAQRVVGVDASSAMIKAARKRLRSRGNVELYRAGLEELPLEDGALDAAFLNLVLHHVGDPQRALGEVARVLGPDGRVVIVDMQQHEREEYRQQMGHVWLGFERAQLLDWLATAGFQQPRYVALPPDPAAKGPPLFVVSAVRRGNSKTARKNGAGTSPAQKEPAPAARKNTK